MIGLKKKVSFAVIDGIAVLTHSPECTAILESWYSRLDGKAKRIPADFDNAVSTIRSILSKAIEDAASGRDLDGGYKFHMNGSMRFVRHLQQYYVVRQEVFEKVEGDADEHGDTGYETPDEEGESEWESIWGGDEDSEGEAYEIPAAMEVVRAKLLNFEDDDDFEEESEILDAKKIDPAKSLNFEDEESDQESGIPIPDSRRPGFGRKYFRLNEGYKYEASSPDGSRGSHRCRRSPWSW